jgi:hypothetical protein
MTSSSVCQTGMTLSSVCQTGRTSSSVCKTGRISSSFCQTGRTSSSVYQTGRTSSSLCQTGMTSSSVCQTGRTSSSVCHADRQDHMHIGNLSDFSTCYSNSARAAHTNEHVIGQTLPPFNQDRALSLYIPAPTGKCTVHSRQDNAS